MRLIAKKAVLVSTQVAAAILVVPKTDQFRSTYFGPSRNSKPRIVPKPPKPPPCLLCLLCLVCVPYLLLPSVPESPPPATQAQPPSFHSRKSEQAWQEL